MSFEPASAAGLRHELEQANVNLNHFLHQQDEAAKEVDRWRQVITQLEAAIELLEKPAMRIQKVPMVQRGAPGVPRIRWSKQWPIVLGELAAKNVHPTKRELIVHIQAKYKVTEANANRAVNNAINKGELDLKMDRCYLPGTAPMLHKTA